MVYHGTNKTEMIWVGPANDLEEMHCIELVESCDEPAFYVTACCNENWTWKFKMDGVTNYETIKHTIMDAAFECDSMGELLDDLDAIFADNFEDILVEGDNEDEDEYECNCCCEYCDHRDCLN